MVTRRTFISVAAALAGARLAAPAMAHGEVVRVLVGFPPGGALDVVARSIAEGMRGPLGGNVIVENKPGASGVLAVQQVASSPPQAGALLLSPASVLTLLPQVSDMLRMDPLTELAPVSTACEVNFGLAVGKAFPAARLDDFVAWCRANAPQAAYGSPGVASGPHLVGAFFAHQAGVPLVHVPYRGGVQAVTDLLGGQLPALFSSLSNLIPMHRDGKMRILAHTGSERVESIADVPTFSEAGFKKLAFSEWFGFFAPGKAAPARVGALQQAIATALEAPSTRAALTRLSFVPRSSTPAVLSSLMREDISRWQALIAEIGFKTRVS